MPSTRSLSSRAALVVSPGVLLLIVGLSAAPPVPASGDPCFRPVAEVMPLIEKMEQSWAGVSDYTAVLVKTERFVDGTLSDERALIRFRKPNQLYLRVLQGTNAGAELLFPKPGTDNVVLGRPGGVTGAVAGFLVNVPAIGGLVPYEFDLVDERLMAGQHHPVTDSSLDGMLRLVSVNVRAAARNREGSACVHPGERVDGRRASRLELLAPAGEGTWHTVVEGETLWTIGADHGQDRHVILYSNPSIDADEALPVGEKVFVPRYYAPRSVIWVGEASNLPLKLQMFDRENRLYESYANTDLRIDVGLTDEDFDPAHHGFPVAATPGESAGAGEERSR